MKINKKYTIIVSSIILTLFIAPLVVFAAVYTSNERKNSFSPGNVDIEVNEGDNRQNETLQNELTWDVSSKSVNKPVKIYDSRTNDGEALRVCLVPMWYDKDTEGNPSSVCSIFNFNVPVQNGNTLVYTDGDMTITLNLNADWKTNGWSYNVEDGCFYYSGTLESGKLTPQLLDNVVLSDSAYALTETYTLRIDVLADAIQTSGNAKESRNW